MEYSRITKSDLEEIIKLYEKYLNPGEFIQDTIREMFEEEKFVGFQAKDGEKIVGFFFGKEGIDFTYPHPELEKDILSVVGTQKLYTPDGLLVLDEYRNQGIAGELIRRMKDWLKANGMEIALVELWIYPDDSVPAREPLMGLGEVIYEKTIPDFYKDLHKYNVRCPICGEKCTCGALIELIRL